MTIFGRSRVISAEPEANGTLNRLAGRDRTNRHPDLATNVSVRLIKPGVAFSRDEGLNVAEYLRHYNALADVRRFQKVLSFPIRRLPTFMRFSLMGTRRFGRFGPVRCNIGFSIHPITLRWSTELAKRSDLRYTLVP